MIISSGRREAYEMHPDIFKISGNTSNALIIKDISKLTNKRLLVKSFISQCSDRCKNSKQKPYLNKFFSVNKIFFQVNYLFDTENGFLGSQLR